MSFGRNCPEGAVAAWTDIHPDEWTSHEQYDLYASLKANPIDGVWPIRVNELTLLNNRLRGLAERQTHKNIESITPEYAAAHPKQYEVWRRGEVVRRSKAARWVIATHSVRDDEEPYVWCSPQANPAVEGIVASLGIKRLGMLTPPLLGHDDPRNVKFEFPPSYMEQYIPMMRQLLGKLAAGWEPEPPPEPLQCYEYFRDVSVEEARQVGLQDAYPSFAPFPAVDQPKLAQLDLPLNSVPVGWNYELYGVRTGCAGEILRPI
jgi:hypothetical protein